MGKIYFKCTLAGLISNYFAPFSLQLATKTRSDCKWHIFILICRPLLFFLNDLFCPLDAHPPSDLYLKHYFPHTSIHEETFLFHLGIGRSCKFCLRYYCWCFLNLFLLFLMSLLLFLLKNLIRLLLLLSVILFYLSLISIVSLFSGLNTDNIIILSMLIFFCLFHFVSHYISSLFLLLFMTLFGVASSIIVGWHYIINISSIPVSFSVSPFFHRRTISSVMVNI